MILEAIILVVASILAILVANVLIVFYRQHKVNQIWKIHSPNLPVAEELTSIFGGHVQTLVCQRRNVSIIDNLHKKYGKTFGVYYNKRMAIATKDLDLIKFMVIDDPYANVNRFPIDIPLEELEVDSIVFAEDKQWRRLRQAFAPAFTNHKIKTNNVQIEIEQVIQKFAMSIDNRIDAAAVAVPGKMEHGGRLSAIVNADDIFHRYALALIFKCFYKQDNIIDFDANKDYWVELMGKTFKTLINPLLVICPVFPSLKPFINWFLMRFHIQGVLRRSIMLFIKKQTKLNLDARKEFAHAKKAHEVEGKPFDADNYHLKDGSKFSRNLIDYFIDQYHEGKLTKDEYFNTTYFIFFAANKTSADAISMLVYQLACHQEIQDKLREAIRTEGQESEYLMWCIYESMRLFPPAPIGCSRNLDHAYTTKEGYYIPANTIVYTSTYSIHRDPEYWGEDANEFNPDRWANSKGFSPVQFLAFGAGKRNCLGKAFALHEMKMLMNVLMKQFKFERCSETSDSNSFQCPMFICTVFDEPHYIKISRL